MNRFTRLASLILSVCMVMTVFAQTLVLSAFADETDADSSGILINESFEETDKLNPKTNLPGHWSLKGSQGATAEIVEGTASNGTHSLKLTDTSDVETNGVYARQIKLTNGGCYRLDVDAFCESGDCEVFVEYYDTNQYLVNSDVVNNTTYGEWETLEINFSAPENASFIKILLSQTSVNTGVVYFDNLIFKSVSSEELYAVDESKKVEYKALTNTYPRLYFGEEGFQMLKDRAACEEASYAGVSGKTMAEVVINEANGYMNEDSFTITYNDNYDVTFNLPLHDPSKIVAIQTPPPGYPSSQYPYWTLLARGVEQRIKMLTLASLITDDQAKADAYANKAIEYGVQLCKWEWWSDRNYEDGWTCLDTTHLTYSALTIYDMLHDRLTDEQKELFKTAIYEKSIVPLAKVAGKHDDTNVQVLKDSALISAVCELMGDGISDEEANEYLNIANSYFKWYLNRLNTSGNNEGIMYATYCIEYMMIAFDHLNRVTGDDSLMLDEYLNDFLMKWVIAAGSNSHNYCAEIGDANTTAGFDVTGSVLNKVAHNGLAGYFLQLSGRGIYGFDSFIYHIDDLYVEEPGEEIQSIYLDKIGWGSMRTGWTASDSMLVFTCSLSNMAHNHLDNNSFVMELNGTWLVRDPGYQDYNGGPNTEYTYAYGHTGIYINDNSQQRKGTGKISEKITSGFISYMIGDDTASYVTGLKINDSQRHFMLVNHESSPYYVIMDNLDSERENEYTWRLNISDIKEVYAGDKKFAAKDMATGNFVRLVGNSASMGVSFSEDLFIERYAYNDEFGQLLDATPLQNSAHHNFLAVLTPTMASGLNLYLGDYVDDVECSIEKESHISNATTDPRGMIMFKPESKGDYFTVPISVGTTGEYKVKMDLAKANLYGSCDIYFDDEFWMSYDGYVDDYFDFNSVDFGEKRLTRGTHTLKFVSTGGADGADAFYIGAISFEAEALDPNAGIARITENLTTDTVTGCKVSYGDDNAEEDLVLYAIKPVDDEAVCPGIDANGVKTDGCQASIFGLDDSSFKTGYSVSDATSLTYNGNLLFESSKPASIGLSAFSDGSMIVAHENETEIKFFVPDSVSKVLINDEEANINGGYVTCTVNAGDTHIDFVVEESSSCNILVIILICAAVLIVIAVAAVIILKAKKTSKKSEDKPEEAKAE